MPQANLNIAAKLALPIALDEGRHGPKFMALPSDRMRVFVLAVLGQGSRNYTHAAIAAGYTGTAGTLRVTAHRLAHDERIQEAIHEEAQRRLMGLVPLALKTVADLMEDPQSKERGKMALAVLDRAGLNATTQHKVTVEHLGDDPARLMRIKLLAEKLGIDPVIFGARLAQLQPPAIDADAVAGETSDDP